MIINGFGKTLALGDCIVAVHKYPVVCTDYSDLYLDPAKHLLNWTRFVHKITQGSQPKNIKKSISIRTCQHESFCGAVGPDLGRSLPFILRGKWSLRVLRQAPLKHCLVPFIFTLLPIMLTHLFVHHSICLMTLSSQSRHAFASLSA